MKNFHVNHRVRRCTTADGHVTQDCNGFIANIVDGRCRWRRRRGFAKRAECILLYRFYFRFIFLLLSLLCVIFVYYMETASTSGV